MNELSLPNAIRQAIMNLLNGSGGLLGNSTAHLWKNNGVNPGPTTLLGAFTESTFQGYAAIAGQSPSGSYQDSAGNWHVTFPSEMWETVNGFEQTMTIALAGAVTMTGTLTNVITAAGMTGSPRTITTNVVNTDTPADYGPEIAANINADVDAGAFFTATYASGVLTLTAKTPAANDATMDATFALGTATGPTPVAHATQSQAGAAPITIDETAYGVYLTDSTGTQYRGASAFTTPVGLTGPNQAVFAFPDVQYGA